MIANETFGVNLVRMTPDGDLHAQRHMELCQSVDMLGLGIVLEQMVSTGHLSPRLAEAFKAQADGLLAIMLAENHRSFIGSEKQSTGSKVYQFGVGRGPICPQCKVRPLGDKPVFLATGKEGVHICDVCWQQDRDYAASFVGR